MGEKTKERRPFKSGATIVERGEWREGKIRS